MWDRRRNPSTAASLAQAFKMCLLLIAFAMTCGPQSSDSSSQQSFTSVLPAGREFRHMENKGLPFVILVLIGLLIQYAPTWAFRFYAVSYKEIPRHRVW